MSKMNKRFRVITAFSATLLLSLAIAGGASADTSTTDREPGAKTTPPPIELNLNSVSPMSTYLSNASSSIKKTTTSMQLTATTYANQSMDLIGVYFQFQRWTGSTWIDIDIIDGSTSNASTYSSTKSFSASDGYYYRGKTLHYVRKGSTYEEQTLFTQSLLMGQ